MELDPGSSVRVHQGEPFGPLEGGSRWGGSTCLYFPMGKGLQDGLLENGSLREDQGHSRCLLQGTSRITGSPDLQQFI